MGERQLRCRFLLFFRPYGELLAVLGDAQHKPLGSRIGQALRQRTSLDGLRPPMVRVVDHRHGFAMIAVSSFVNLPILERDKSSSSRMTGQTKLRAPGQGDAGAPFLLGPHCTKGRLYAAMGETTYGLMRQKDGRIGVEMMKQNGRRRTIPDFRDEAEANAWIIQMRRLTDAANPHLPARAAKYSPRQKRRPFRGPTKFREQTCKKADSAARGCIAAMHDVAGKGRARSHANARPVEGVYSDQSRLRPFLRFSKLHRRQPAESLAAALLMFLLCSSLWPPPTHPLAYSDPPSLPARSMN